MESPPNMDRPFRYSGQLPSAGHPDKGHFEGMAGLEPEIVVVNGLHENGGHTGAVAADGVGVDLIPRQSRLRGGHLEFIKALPDAAGEGLPCVGDAGQVMLPAELRNPVLMAVGNDAQLNSAVLHGG